MGGLRTAYRNLVWTLVPDRLAVQLQFRKAYRRSLDLSNPVTFDEKLQWYKLYYRRPLMTLLADKCEVRNYVADKGLGHILNERYGVYERFEDIPFDSLPEAFVLKATHGCSWNVICRDKGSLDLAAAARKFKRWLRTNYYRMGGEWAYKHIKPRIICERYLENLAYGELIDYKIYCYDGKPTVLFVCCGRFSPGGVRYDAYDMDWNQIHTFKGKPTAGLNLPRPSNLDDMRTIAERLSEGFPFIRVDLYSIEGNIYFGELTFYPDNGLVPFTPESFNVYFGDFFKLPPHPVYQ